MRKSSIELDDVEHALRGMFHVVAASYLEEFQQVDVESITVRAREAAGRVA